MDWQRYGSRVHFLQPEILRDGGRYQLRLVASIVLAETARQVGQRQRVALPRPDRRRPAYDLAVDLEAPAGGELIYMDELVDY
jgi:hypothetical protein